MAEVASKASSVDPFDTGIVANLDVVDEITLGNNNTCALVATNKR